MNQQRLKILWLLLGLLSVALGMIVSRSLRPQDGDLLSIDSTSPSHLTAGLPVVDFSLPDLDNKIHSIKEWTGKLVFLNFWATWCPPCRKEIPAFIKLQAQYQQQGLQFIGIAIDNPGNVRDFMTHFQVNYPMLIGEKEGYQLNQMFGNLIGALPYTVVLNPKGQIIFSHAGELSEPQAEMIIKKFLNP